MAPHLGSVEFQDDIEVQHIEGLTSPVIRMRMSPRESSDKSNFRRLRQTKSQDSSSKESAQSNRRIRSQSLSEFNNRRDTKGNSSNTWKVRDDDDESVVLQQSTSVDSADRDTIYDTFTSICSPVCGEGGIRLKSALKKGGSPADAIQTKRNVSFNSLTVREYEMTLGDHPSSASGPPVQLDWEPKNESTLDLNDYEETRQPRKTRRDLKMSFQEREQILQQRGYTIDELKNAWMEALKIRQQRYETIMTGTFTTKVEEAWESARRKFLRFFTLSTDMEGFEVRAASTPPSSAAAAAVTGKKNTDNNNTTIVGDADHDDDKGGILRAESFSYVKDVDGETTTAQWYLFACL